MRTLFRPTRRLELLRVPRRWSFGVVLTVVAAAASLLYGLYLFRTMQQFVDFDQYQYYWNIRRSLTGSRPLPIFNPHHLQLEFMSERFHNHMVNLFGDAGFTNLAFNLRLRALVTATVGIFLFITFMGVLTRGIVVSLASAAALAFTHGYVMYATKIDTAIYPTVGLIAILICALWVDRGGRLWPVAVVSLALSFFFAVMAHVYMAIGAAVAGVVLLLPPVDRLLRAVRPFFRSRDGARAAGRVRFRDRHLRRVTATLLAGVAAVAMIVGAYVFVGRGVYNLPYDGQPDTGSRDLFSGLTFQQWLFLYEVVSDAWGYGVEEFSPDQPIRGYTDAFLARTSSYRTYGIVAPFEYDLSAFTNREALPFNVLAAVTVGTLALSVLLFPLLLRRYGRAFLAVMSMVGPYFVFFTYWEPSYMEFWLIPSVLTIILATLVLNLAAESLGRVFAPPERRSMTAAFARLTGALAVGVFAATLAFHNVQHYVIPFSQMKLREGIPLSWTESAINLLYADEVYRRPIELRWPLGEE